MPAAGAAIDHPIFRESLRIIRAMPGMAAALAPLTSLQQDVVLRLIHSSGDPELVGAVTFSPGACEAGVAALAAGAPILTDTAMAAAAVAPMAGRTFGNLVRSVLDWAPARAPAGSTRAAVGMELALAEVGQARGLPAAAPVVLIGSAPTALEVLLERVGGVAAGGASGEASALRPALVIGMPVGFVGVAESKRRLAASGLAHVGLAGSKGGAGLVAAACNALLRAGWLQAACAPSP